MKFTQFLKMKFTELSSALKDIESISLYDVFDLVVAINVPVNDFGTFYIFRVVGYSNTKYELMSNGAESTGVYKSRFGTRAVYEPALHLKSRKENNNNLAMLTCYCKFESVLSNNPNRLLHDGWLFLNSKITNKNLLNSIASVTEVKHRGTSLQALQPNFLSRQKLAENLEEELATVVTDDGEEVDCRTSITTLKKMVLGRTVINSFETRPTVFSNQQNLDSEFTYIKETGSDSLKATCTLPFAGARKLVATKGFINLVFDDDDFFNTLKDVPEVSAGASAGVAAEASAEASAGVGVAAGVAAEASGGVAAEASGGVAAEASGGVAAEASGGVAAEASGGVGGAAGVAAGSTSNISFFQCNSTDSFTFGFKTTEFSRSAKIYVLRGNGDDKIYLQHSAVPQSTAKSNITVSCKTLYDHEDYRAAEDRLALKTTVTEIKTKLMQIDEKLVVRRLILVKIVQDDDVISKNILAERYSDGYVYWVDEHDSAPNEINLSYAFSKPNIRSRGSVAFYPVKLNEISQYKICYMTDRRAFDNVSSTFLNKLNANQKLIFMNNTNAILSRCVSFAAQNECFNNENKAGDRSPRFLTRMAIERKRDLKNFIMMKPTDTVFVAHNICDHLQTVLEMITFSRRRRHKHL